MPRAAVWEKEPGDLRILRELAQRKRDLSAHPDNVERRRLWHLHDAGAGERPMVLTESGVAFDDLPESRLHCREDWARDLERGLRFELFQFEVVGDDHVIEPYVNCRWDVTVSDYGVAPVQEYAERVSGNVSSRRWAAPLADLDGDLARLHPRTHTVDRERTSAWKAHLEEVFDGLLPVRMRGGYWWTLGLTIVAIDLIGLEGLMTSMCTDPEGLHRLMGFLRDDHRAFVEWIEREGLLTLNNENDYIGSGSMGYTGRLPAEAGRPGGRVLREDLWTLAESQETVSVSPGMFEEFVFQYQQPLVEGFGSVYYGCCEPVHLRWPVLRRLSNLKRVSVSPWCDEAYMAEALGRDYVYSRKPNPTLVSTSHFDEDAIRADIAGTLRVAGGCSVEFILKDVHTLAGEPRRMARWVELAREVIAESLDGRGPSRH